MTTGWKCPVCGRGNAPFADHCNCYREDKPKQESAEQKFYELSNQNDAQNQVQKRMNQSLTDCPRCWQHGFSRTHGLMEVCPYHGQTR